MKRALIIIDVQNDYFPGGAMELHNSVEAARCISGLLEFFRGSSLPVIHVQHLSARPGANFFLPGTPGAEFYPVVMPLPGEKTFVKHFPNSFRGTGLDEYLKSEGITKLVVAGMMTHLCVDTTVRAAFDLGYEVTLAGDCCATRSLTFNGKSVAADDVQNAFLASINGLFASVYASDKIIADLKNSGLLPENTGK